MKLFKFTCGVDDRIGVFENEEQAYDRRAEVDPTYNFLPVQITEIEMPGHVIVPEGMVFDEASKQTLDQLISCLSEHVGETGESEGAVEVLDRLLVELNVFREHRQEALSNADKANKELQDQLDPQDDKVPDDSTANVALEPAPEPEPEQDKPLDIDNANQDELRAWLDQREIKYHPQLGEKKLRALVEEQLTE